VGPIFSEEEPTVADQTHPPQPAELHRDFLGVPGLLYAPALLSAADQQRILAALDALPWQDDLRRRVQHYGYKYDYKARAVDPSAYVGPLPPFGVEVAQRLAALGLVEEAPDQLIVNEYQPGQGISAHVDCEPCFKNVIVTVSLGSAYEMDFIEVASGAVRAAVLEVGSALVMRDAGRYLWMHRIKARKSDHGVPRGRRVSLTFRNVILQPPAPA
jgi:alkylated DNA repair dioxygenase AlkB